MADKKKENRELSPALKGKYELKGIIPGRMQYTKFKKSPIDFRTMSLEEADALYASGHASDHLVKVEPKAETKSK